MSYERFEREHIVVLIAVIALVFIVLKSVLTPASSAGPPLNNNMPETNLDGLRVMDKQSPRAVSFGDGTTQYFPNDFAGVFINGSILENANIIIENERAIGPVRLISEKLGAKVSWDDATRTVTIIDGDKTIVFTIGDVNAKKNETPVAIGAVPRIIDDYAYVPIRFITDSLGCESAWFDGVGEENSDGTGIPQPHYLLRMQQVMISRYPEGAARLTAPEAVQRVKGQLIAAYEKKYGAAFQPLPDKLDEMNGQEKLRYGISNLYVTSENDRFFIIPMMRDFMIDKFTGMVYVYYDGDVQTINRFEPNSEDALAFAG